MTRPSRVFFERAIYHVHNRLAREEQALGDDLEATRFVEILREVSERDGLVILASCLMSNHYHLAVRVTTVASRPTPEIGV